MSGNTQQTTVIVREKLKEFFAWLTQVKPNALILVIFVFFLLFPIFVISYQILFENVGSIESALFKNISRYASNSTSHDKVWTILAPILFAFSAGSSLQKGVSWKAAVLVVVFFSAFILADYAASELSSNTTLAENLSNRDKINIEQLIQYCTSISGMCVTSIAILLGLAVAKQGD